MANIQHFIDGQDLGVPRNWEDLEITIDWKNKKEVGDVGITELSFVHQANKFLQERIMNGLNGGVGAFEGVPYKIVIGQLANPTFEFNGYLDLTDNAIMIGGEEITLSLKKEHGEDWLNDVADGFSFAYLHDIGIINNSDFVKVPYVINYIPDNMQLIVLTMSIYMMTKEIIENIEALTGAISEIVNAVTPTVGVSVGLGAGVVTAWDLGDFIWAGLNVIARIIYIIGMVIAIKNLIEQLFEQLLPKKRYHLGMSFYTLMEKGCQHLGLGFQSELLSNRKNWIHIPRKDKKGGENGEKGFPENGGSIYTFGDFIRVMKEKYHADFRIIDGVFIFERSDFFEITGGFQLPAYFNNQERLLHQFQLNTNEIVSNYNILWQYDTQDQNTLDDQTGRVFQAITSPITKINDKFVVIKNLTQIELPFSQGKEKTKLTDVEKLFKKLASVVDGLTGLFGNGTNYVSKIEDRVGSLLLSSHFLTVGKVVVMNGDKLANNQRDLLNARKLWDEFHFISSFVEVNGVHNQFHMFKDERIPMKLDEFAQLLDNNKITDSNGIETYIDLVRYSPYKNTAIVNYRIKKKYTNNLKIEYVE